MSLPVEQDEDRLKSPGSSGVFLKSDRFMGKPVYFNDEPGASGRKQTSLIYDYTDCTNVVEVPSKFCEGYQYFRKTLF